MHAERAALADTEKFSLPPDLLAEVSRRVPAKRDDFRVDGWKPSLFGRLMELLAGGKRRD